ncbi:hypothetical protein BDP55DRAFT_277842 [Colletotrichum godetiae]|uniref:Uncharacterized protein n=1 Tax=Colletotrichum godetiae TaxID=1209918 RepID=A0AAJ0AHZ4_9PEZI|nr:uncharacterized protein BDP55DRAFT_277842 [Colletotrichum godetiae]KAK1672061.1 hypothetical protein BDP55DRAFT_277842 [Colletotrichum godetiae]
MYRIVHTLYCTAVPELCVVVSLKTSTSRPYTSGWKIPRGTPGSFAIANEQQTEEEKCPLFLTPGRALPRYIPIPFLSPNLLPACSPSRPALPSPNFLALDIHLSCPIPFHPNPSSPSLARHARWIRVSINGGPRLVSPVVPAFLNRPDVCPSSTTPKLPSSPSLACIHFTALLLLLDTASVTNQNHTVAPLRKVERPVRLASDWAD